MATPYYGLILPTVGASADTWGGLVNQAFTDLDADLASPANSFKGNNTGATAASINLTVTQATAMLNVVVGDSGAGGTKGLVPAPAAGDAAAGKFLTAAGTWSAALNDIKAWGYLTGAGSLTIERNVASTVRTGVGAYTVTFTSALASALYGVTFGYEGPFLGICRVTDGTKTTGGFQFTVIENSGSPIDVSAITFSVLG